MSDLMFSSYDRFSDDQLTEMLEFKRNYLQTSINRDIQWISAQYFDKEINCLETILRQRISQNAYLKALKDKSDGEARMVKAAEKDDKEDCDEVVVDDEAHPQPLLAPPQSTPFCHPDNTTTNAPPDILAPPPLPPSPNIFTQLSQSHPQPHNHHAPDIVAPPPLPPSPNISVQLPQHHLHIPQNQNSFSPLNRSP
jgi:hypothetical protein